MTEAYTHVQFVTFQELPNGWKFPCGIHHKSCSCRTGGELSSQMTQTKKIIISGICMFQHLNYIPWNANLDFVPRSSQFFHGNNLNRKPISFEWKVSLIIWYKHSHVFILIMNLNYLILMSDPVLLLILNNFMELCCLNAYSDTKEKEKTS